MNGGAQHITYMHTQMFLLHMLHSPIHVQTVPSNYYVCPPAGLLGRMATRQTDPDNDTDCFGDIDECCNDCYNPRCKKCFNSCGDDGSCINEDCCSGRNCFNYCLRGFTLLSFFASFGIVLAFVIVFGKFILLNTEQDQYGTCSCNLCEENRGHCFAIVVTGSMLSLALLAATLNILNWWCR